MKDDNTGECTLLEISDEDILKAMRAMHGHIDITPNDFKEVYLAAFAHAVDRLKNALTAADLMTQPAHVIHLETDLIETAQALADKGISGAPVVDSDGKIVGVISEKDFLKRMGAERTGAFMEVIAQCLKNKGCIATPMRNMKVADIMSKPAITASEDLTISNLSSLLMDKGINRLPIVDKFDKPIGMVARSDLVRSYCQF